MNTMLRVAHITALVFALALPAVVSTARAQTPTQDIWQADIDRFAAQDLAQPPANAPIVFVGSSSIRLWRDLSNDFSNPGILNRGFGGSRLSDIERLADRVVLRYLPRQVVIYAGDNDLAEGLSPAQVAADFVSLVRHLRAHSGALDIAFIAIKPSPARAQLVAAARETNQRIRDFARAEDHIAFIDVFTPMLDAGGSVRAELFGPDGLHMNAAGYALWAEVVAPYLR